jgi:hypothetical protein
VKFVDIELVDSDWMLSQGLHLFTVKCASQSIHKTPLKIDFYNRYFLQLFFRVPQACLAFDLQEYERINLNNVSSSGPRFPFGK